VAARPAPGRRFGLFNNQLSVHELNGPTEQRTLGSVAQIRSTLETCFGLHLAVDPALDTALARLIA
jgi:N-hydroxyarylamine O-acetyltransferase